jgi:two-component system, NtrC family, response regulator GlrR
MDRLLIVGSGDNAEALERILSRSATWSVARTAGPPSAPCATAVDLVLVVSETGDDWGSVLRRASPAASRHLVPVVERSALDRARAVLGPDCSEFLAWPADEVETTLRIGRVLDRQRAHREAETAAQVRDRCGPEGLVGEHPAFREVKAKLPLVGRAEATVTISGETGTGKEVVTRAVHNLSRRADGPFVPVNCGAIPRDLIENELFGHRKGAFTDARESLPGLIAQAEGGTLFLDEVDAIPPSGQVKLLQFLQNRTYRPLGSGALQRADVRVVAATNSDLPAAIRAGSFRADLYYRLNIIALRLPPLRERRSDIPLLARHFLAKHQEGHGSVRSLEPELLAFLEAQPWPGNVRELENLVERMLALSPGGPIGLDDLPEDLAPRPTPASPPGFRAAKARVVATFERDYALRLLALHGGNVTRAARAARQDRRAFGRLLKKHALGHPAAAGSSPGASDPTLG